MFLNNNDHTKLIRTTVYKKKFIVFKIKILKQRIRTKTYTMLLKFINMISDSI